MRWTTKPLITQTPIEVGRTYLYPGVTSTAYPPAATSVSPRLYGWDGSRVPGPYWAEIFRDISGDSVSPYNAGFQALVQSVDPGRKLGIYGGMDTVTAQADASKGYGDTAGSMPYNIVRGDHPMVPITYSRPDQSDTGSAVPFDPTMAMQVWPAPRGWAGSACTLTRGSATVTSRSGSNFLGTTYIEAGQTYSLDFTRPTRLYTIQSVDSASQITLTEPYAGTLVNGQIQGPYSRPPTMAELYGDRHLLIWQRDEATGQPSKLWELFGVGYDSGGLQAESGSLFDLVTGAQRKDSLTSAATGGLPMLPLMITYEECLNGLVPHPMRLVIGNYYGLSNACVWPATHSAGTFSGSGTYVDGYAPCGARFRLNADRMAYWLTQVPDIYKPILVALNTFGAIVVDWFSGVGFGIELLADYRWPDGSHNPLNSIPVTDFEMLANVKPQINVSCPSSASVGVPIDVTLSYDNAANTNIALTTISIQVRNPLGSTTILASKTVDTTHRSWTWTWTPSMAGVHTFSIYRLFLLYWLQPLPWTVTVA